MFAICSQFSSTFYHPRTDHCRLMRGRSHVCMLGAVFMALPRGCNRSGHGWPWHSRDWKGTWSRKMFQTIHGELASGDEGGVMFLFMFAVCSCTWCSLGCYCSFQVLGIYHPGGDSDGLSDIGYCVDLPVPGRNNGWLLHFQTGDDICNSMVLLDVLKPWAQMTLATGH